MAVCGACLLFVECVLRGQLALEVRYFGGQVRCGLVPVKLEVLTIFNLTTHTICTRSSRGGRFWILTFNLIGLRDERDSLVRLLSGYLFLTGVISFSGTLSY